MAKACPNTKTPEWKNSVEILDEKGAIKSWLRNDDIIDPKISLYQNYLEEDFNSALNLLDQYINDSVRSTFNVDTSSRTIIESANSLLFKDKKFSTFIGNELSQKLKLNALTPAEQTERKQLDLPLPTQTATDLSEINKQINIANEDSLFGILKKEYRNIPGFYANTLDVVMNFLENIGVEPRLVNQILSEDGNVVKNALAVANFMNGSVDIINDIEKRGKAWDKVPEEAAHFFYRLLKDTAPLKEELWQAAKRSKKLEQLLNDATYKKAYDMGLDPYEAIKCITRCIN